LPRASVRRQRVLPAAWRMGVSRLRRFYGRRELGSELSESRFADPQRGGKALSPFREPAASGAPRASRAIRTLAMLCGCFGDPPTAICADIGSYLAGGPRFQLGPEVPCTSDQSHAPSSPPDFQSHDARSPRPEARGLPHHGRQHTQSPVSSSAQVKSLGKPKSDQGIWGQLNQAASELLRKQGGMAAYAPLLRSWPDLLESSNITHFAACHSPSDGIRDDSVVKTAQIGPHCVM
jgi:hypothetical protein